MKKLFVLFIFMFIIPVASLSEEIVEETSVDKVPWPPDTTNVEVGDPEEAVWMYVTRRIDADDVPADIKKFANDNDCFAIMKSYHWSSPVFRYGNVYMCDKNNKIQYIMEKNGKIKFANFWLRKKLNIPVYSH